MRTLDLFAGIGGFPLAGEWMGWEMEAWVEWDPFCQAVLRHHFPKATGYGDITQTDFTSYANRIDIITAGFPCQNISLAASRNRTGVEGEKSGLWKHALRATNEVKPSFVLLENSATIINHGLGIIMSEFAKIGYDAEWYCLQPKQFGLPQKRRDRCYILLYTTSIGNRLQEEQIFTGWDKSLYPAWRDSDHRVYGMAHGIPDRVAKHRALGNAAPPVIPLQIFKAIEAYGQSIK